MIGSPGFLADAVTLQKQLRARQVMYQHNHGKLMSCPAMAQVCRLRVGLSLPCALRVTAYARALPHRSC